MKTVNLDEAAKSFQVHPRTILRALSDETNIYWSEGFDPPIYVTALANAYSMKEKVLIRVLESRDTLLKPSQAAKELHTPARTFRWRKYNAAARKGGIVRYSRAQIINEHLLRWTEEAQDEKRAARAA